MTLADFKRIAHEAKFDPRTVGQIVLGERIAPSTWRRLWQAAKVLKIPVGREFEVQP